MEKPLVDFLRYVEQSDGSAIADDCDEKLRHLHEKVKRIKASSQVEVSYLRTQERERLIREAGREEGQIRKLLEQISKKIYRGDSQEKIADDLCEEMALVHQFSEALEKCSPAHDIDAAMRYLKMM